MTSTNPEVKAEVKLSEAQAAIVHESAMLICVRCEERRPLMYRATTNGWEHVFEINGSPAIRGCHAYKLWHRWPEAVTK